jgi:hypothetical protein
MPMSIWRINGNHCSTSLDERKAEIHTGRIAMIHHQVRNTYGDEALGRQYGEAGTAAAVGRIHGPQFLGLTGARRISKPDRQS